jgi:hypothetical protein
VKGWHSRTFPDEWLSADNKGRIKEDRQPIRRSRPQPQLHIDVPYQQQGGYSLQTSPDIFQQRHRQDDFKYTQNGYVRQTSANTIDSRYRQDSLQYQQNDDVPQLPSPAAVDPPYQENIRQGQQGGYIPHMPPVSFHTTYKQDSPQDHYHDFVPQMSEDFYQLDEHFPGLSQNPIDFDNVEDTSRLDGDLSLSADDQQLNIQDNESARQLNPASQHQRSNPLQHSNHQSVPQLPADPLTIGSRNDRDYSTPNPQQLDCSFEGQHGTLKPSAKHYRTSSVFDNPTPPPQCPLPPAPMKFGVLHKGHNQTSWRPIGTNGSSVVKVNPDGFPTDHRRKRVKGQPGSESRDSIALYQLQLNVPNPVPQEGPASQAVQSDTTRNPTVSHHVHPSKVSVHSDFRDSGYVSLFDSAVLNPIRSSFSSLNLADDVDFKTDYGEAGDGFVDVEVKAKWRMRRSYLEKLGDVPVNGPSSQSLAD